MGRNPGTGEAIQVDHSPFNRPLATTGDLQVERPSPLPCGTHRLLDGYGETPRGRATPSIRSFMPVKSVSELPLVQSVPSHSDYGRVKFVGLPANLPIGAACELCKRFFIGIAGAVDICARQIKFGLQTERLLETINRLRHPVLADPLQILRRGIGRSRVRCDAPAELS
jgi:hypothetical protein